MNPKKQLVTKQNKKEKVPTGAVAWMRAERREKRRK
jgi:hypothetical protein